MSESDLPVLEATPDQVKTAALGMPDKIAVEGFTVYPFTAMRKAFLEMSGNEILRSSEHVKKFKGHTPDLAQAASFEASTKAYDEAVVKANELPDTVKREEALKAAAEAYENNKDWDIMEHAVPDFAFHMTALAFIATASVTELSKLIGKKREVFNETVTKWWNDLPEGKWNPLTQAAFIELVESNIGNDYKVKDDPGSKPSPN